MTSPVSKIKELLKNKLLRTGGIYTLSSMFKSVVTMITGLIMIKWLDPKEIGMWQAIAIIQAYLPFAQLGVQSGLNRELPVLLGKGETETAYNNISTAKSYALFIMLLFFVITTVSMLVLVLLGKSSSLILGVLTIGIIAISRTYQNHLAVTFRSANAFNKLAKVHFFYALLLIALMWFIYEYKYYGILIYQSASFIGLAIMTHFARPYKFVKPKFYLEKFKKLLKTGLIMVSLIQLNSMATSIPKLIILKLKGIAMLGLYSPAIAIQSMFMLLPASLAQFFHPQMGYKYGQTGNAKDLWPYSWKLYLFLFAAGIPIAVMIWFLTPFLLNEFFPNYLESLWPMRIMAVAFIFAGTYTVHGVLYSIKAFKYAYFYAFAELFLYILIPGSFAYFGKNILVDVTIGLLISKSVLSVINLVLIRHVLFLPKYNHNTTAIKHNE